MPLTSQVKTQQRVFAANPHAQEQMQFNINYSYRSDLGKIRAVVSSEAQKSVCGLEHATIRKAIKIRQFYKTGEPYLCKVCQVQLSSTGHFVEADKTFLKFQLMFNLSCEAGQSDQFNSAPAYYSLACEGCHSVIGAKPATMSSSAVI